MANVCILSTAHYTFDPRIFYREANALTNAGHNVSFITHHGSNEERDGIEILSLGEADTKIDRWIDVWSAYRVAKGLNADVYHLHDPELIPAGILLSVRTDASVIYDVHEDYETVIRHRNWIPDPISVPFAELFPAVQSAVSIPFDGIVAATDWIEEDFVKRGHENVDLIRNFPRIEDIDFTGEAKPPEADLTLVYVGSFGGNHGLMQMIALLEELRSREFDAELWVIGEFRKPAFETRVRKRVSSSPHGDSIHLLGYIDYEEMFSYLYEADLGLALVDKELYEYCVPNKVFEYMAAELPVMVPDTKGMQRYLPNDCGFCVTVTDTEQQADIIEETGVDDLKRMGENGRMKVEEEYCWEQEQDRLLELYETLL